jgi:hypothetical protein
MVKTNVVMMGQFREMRDTRKSQDNYKRYLTTLVNSQLESEINFLLEEFSMDSYGQDFFFKVRLVQSELVSRADDDWKVRIENMNQETGARDHEAIWDGQIPPSKLITYRNVENSLWHQACFLSEIQPLRKEAMTRRNYESTATALKSTYCAQSGTGL